MSGVYLKYSLIVQSDQDEECLCITEGGKNSLFAVFSGSLKCTQSGVCAKTIIHFVGLGHGYYIFFQVVSFKVWLLCCLCKYFIHMTNKEF